MLEIQTLASKTAEITLPRLVQVTYLVMDDWSALELEGDDVELENLFGNTKSTAQLSKATINLKARPSPQASQCSVLQPHSTASRSNVIPAPAFPASSGRSPASAQTRKRDAAALGLGSSRSAERAIFSSLSDSAYDELELESLSAVAAPPSFSQLMQRHATQGAAVRPELPQHARLASQNTEQWFDVPEAVQRTSQQTVAMSRPVAGVVAGATTGAADSGQSATYPVNVSLVLCFKNISLYSCS